VGLVVLDAGVLIGYRDPTDAYHAAARVAFASARDRSDSLALPASALAECLVFPIRRGDEEVARFQQLLADFPIEVVSLDARIAEATARLRARFAPGLRLPDAMVIATAQVLDADRLLTTDHRWPTRTALGLRGELQPL
jgi:predicted nucleic acid-binding protein